MKHLAIMLAWAAIGCGAHGQNFTAAAAGLDVQPASSATRSSRVGCHHHACKSTETENENVRRDADDPEATEVTNATQRERAGARHREGPSESADDLHPGGQRGHGGSDARDAEGPGVQAVVQLWLARASVAECDFMLPDCHAATWHTLQRRWRRAQRRWPTYTLDQMARNYCAAFKGKPDGRKRWVRGLLAAGTQPDGWPSGASWERHSRWWARVYARAGAFLRGEVKDPCRGRPTHFGNVADMARFPPSEWKRIRCGRTGGQQFVGAT